MSKEMRKVAMLMISEARTLQEEETVSTEALGWKHKGPVGTAECRHSGVQAGME